MDLLLKVDPFVDSCSRIEWAAFLRNLSMKVDDEMQSQEEWADVSRSIGAQRWCRNAKQVDIQGAEH